MSTPTADRGIRLHVLDVRIERPCPLANQGWSGSERTRHCEVCGLDVHNLTAMSAAEAGTLLSDARGDGRRLCARYEMDRHGHVITRDAPVVRPNLVTRAAFRLLGAMGLIGFAQALTGCTGLGGSVYFVDKAEHAESGPEQPREPETP